MRGNLRAKWILAGLCSLTAWACGGGNGLGPTEIKHREAAVEQQLELSWKKYNAGDLDGSISGFRETLDAADHLDVSSGTTNLIKGEAYDGIGWSAFRQQDLDLAASSFQQSVALNRQNTDAWVGWGGVSLAQRQFTNTVQFCITALDADLHYNSTTRTYIAGLDLSHDAIDTRSVRLMLAEAYLNLGYYSPVERADPFNASAQVRLLRPSYQYER